MGKNNQQKPIKQYQKFGIRKFTQGVASVMIASGMFFMAGGVASANEVAAQTETTTQKVVEETAPKKAEEKQETKQEEKTVQLDKTQLENYIKEITSNIEAGKYASKTEESVATLKSELSSAQATLSSAKTQEELTKAYQQLVMTVNSKLKNKPVEKKETPATEDTTNGKPTVGKAAENTEPVSETNSIANTGKNDQRNGKEIEEKGSTLRSANEGYTASSTELRKENGEFLGSTGKSYKVLDGNANYKIYVHGYQSENTDVPAANSGQAGTSGRTDIPLSKTEAQKVGREAELWKGKLRATGKTNGNTTWGAGGAYEYLATEIYGYTYEQGNHYVYLTDVKKRFSLSPEATAAGYTITKIEASNLPPGLAYNATTDTVEGYVASTLQNGVYDMRYIVTVEKGGATQQVTFRDLTAGWIGWQDSSAPLIQGKSKLVTVGDQVNHNIKYVDNDGMTRDERAGYVYRSNGEKVVAGSKTAPGGTNGATFTAVDGSKINTENGPQTVTAHTALNGNYTGSKTSINDVVPGLNYDPKTGDITGTASEAGIYTAAVYAKDYNNTTNAKNQDWNMYGQEAHENITIAVAPKITVKNVEAYATNVPVTISNGANKAEITMPDGTVTKLVAKNGNWVVAAGTTNTAVQEGSVLAPVATSGESTINLTVTPESTKYVGVDSIAAKATTDKVKANIQREFAMVNDAAGNTYKAMFNRATGKYSLPTEKAYELTDNGNGTSTLIERRVYTDAQANGDVKFVVYEFERTWNTTSSASTLVDKIAEIRKNGEVTAVGNVTRTETLVKKDNTSSEQGMVVTVSYDSVTNQWTSSDGTAVTAKESNAGWEVETASGFKGYISYREASSTDVASIQNAKPTGTSTSYSEAKGTSVDLIKSPKANVAFADTIDDKTSAIDSDTIKTKVTATAPDGTVTTFDGAQAEETAYIQAQRTASAKTQAAATALKEQQDTQNELARLQELLDRSTRTVEDAQVALDNLKLRTISPTAQELAERKLANVKAFKASIEEQLATAKANLSTKNTEVESTRTAALEAERAVETARAALKTAAEANLAKANAYVLSQKGRYKVTARAVDSNGVVTTPIVDGTDAGEVTEDAVAETTYYIVVTDPEKSSGAQGQKQTDSIADNFNDGKEGTTVSDYKLVDPTTGNKVSSVTTDQGTYTVDPTTGEVTFTPVEGFVGTATPMKVSANVTFNDESGNPVTVATENTYTPTVYGVQPSADETTGKQGQPQTSKSGKDRFSELNKTTNTPDGTNVDWTTAAYSLEGANAEGKVVVDGEGTYSIDPTTGVVTFEPLPTFTGKAKGVNVQVSVTATDSEGNKVPVTSKGKYTPEVTPVKPTGEDVTSSGKQGQEQTGTPKFIQGDETAPITINEQQPAKFVVNGQPVEDKEIPATKDGKEIGKYVIDPLTGVVTFKPNKDFVGTPDPATVEVKDKNGTPATATYTPTVTPVVPTAEPKETTDIQGKTQTGKPTFTPGADEVPMNDEVPATFEDGSTEKVIPGEGTYTVAPDGTVTFTPEKNFTGEGTGVTVKRVDKNGTPVTAKYTPVVVPVTPTSKDSESEGPKGQPQSGTPTFEGGKVTINGKEVPVEIDETVKPTFEDGTTEKKVPGEGTYTIDENGKVTFTPEPDFVGKATGVTVKRVDKNGTPVTAKYTPTVRPDTTHVDKDGNPLSPTEDGTKPTKDIPGYKVVKTEIDEKGNTKHIYEKVTTTHKDKDGNVIPNYPVEEGENPKKDIPGYRFVETKKLPNGDVEHVYEKVKTSHKDKDGNEIPNYPTEDGEQPKKDIPGYRFVETKKLPNGDTEHVYEKVKTSHKDKDGNEIPNYPTEDGEQPKKDIPGYRFVETKKLPNGDVEHVYEKVKTSHKDKDGNEIPNYPTEDGEQPKKDIPGYRFVETKKLPNGDVEHVYEKVKTSHKDKEGNEIPNYPTEDGEQPKKDIPGYRFVETKKLPNGDIEHVYEKVTNPTPTPVVEKSTTWVDENGNPLKQTEKGTKDPGSIPGYELVNTVVDKDGNVQHIFRKVTTPNQPVTPAKPEQPVKPEVPAKPAPQEKMVRQELPQTGTGNEAAVFGVAASAALAGLGMMAPTKKKQDEE